MKIDDRAIARAERIHDGVVRTLNSWLVQIPDPDRVIAGIAGADHGALSPRRIVEHVAEGTEFGDQLVDGLLNSFLKNFLSAQLDGSSVDPNAPSILLSADDD